MDLPFVAYSTLPPSAELDFDFEDFEYDSKKKAYIYEEEFTYGVADFTLVVAVFFDGDELSKITFSAHMIYTEDENDTSTLEEVLDFSDVKLK